eukprot:CAMPEP_0180160200 /NCGR_PEP_ID=MMETSP0986-20121125/27968_1 /TAXON_ID=697907 /ORGANISM="non described non described, Strain CCMP2293" /LENGTH=105 /DNA_ID=CAMNT_0022110411 /DNA_START=208 /DNA_END=522 /DNA_ORIENTATION=+
MSRSAEAGLSPDTTSLLPLLTDPLLPSMPPSIHLDDRARLDARLSGSNSATRGCACYLIATLLPPEANYPLPPSDPPSTPLEPLPQGCVLILSPANGSNVCRGGP